jgi:heme/copper-type cytochrome/quinol oxidase subunit 4
MRRLLERLVGAALMVIFAALGVWVVVTHLPDLPD